ncbi:RNA methyltransferase [Campylobacter sp. RM12654]|uniref:TrmH family RNA methyltransferase n=1 Tax=Campylobacter sp. RM12654 TaxID=2735738 RepID=UPI0030149346|nr:RNA methyltransferase [Campylobacter sp. RM12654]
MIIYGKQVLMHYITKHPEKIEEIYLAKDLDKDSFRQITKLGKKIHKLDFIKAQAMAKGGNHQGYLAKVSEYELANVNEFKKFEKIVLLHELSDVGNIGSIARSAYALGFDGIIHSGNNINIEAVMRSSAGALLELKLAFTKDILSLVNEFKQVGFSFYAANNSENAKEHNKIKYATKSVLVMGSEGNGLSSKIIKSCNEEVKITMKNNFDSLNVSNAFAILGDRMINE